MNSSSPSFRLPHVQRRGDPTLASELGASLAAFGAGAIRTGLGDYSVAFWIAGGLCAGAVLSFLTIGRRTFVQHPPSKSFAAAIALND